MKPALTDEYNGLAATTGEISELHFRTFVENVNDVIFALTPAGIFSYVSPQWKEAFGYEMGETIGMPFIPFVHPEDVPACLAFLQKVMDTGNRQSGVEYRILCKDGRYLWNRANGSLVHDPVTGVPAMIGIGRNIDELKQMEESLAESREKFRCLSEAAYEAIFISEKGLCLAQNKRAEELFGYSGDEAIGRPGTEWIVPEDRELVMRNMLNGYEQAYEVNGLCKNGSTFPALIRGRMMQFRGGAVRVTSMTNITDKKELQKYRLQLEELVRARTVELESVNSALAIEINQSQQAHRDIERLNIDLRQRTEELELANRDLESFSYSVSHDLRAPLRHMSGYSKILLEDYGNRLDNNAKIYLKRIGHAAGKLELLTDALLKLASINRGSLILQEVDLSAMAREVITELQESEPLRSVRTEIAANLNVTADGDLLRAMLHNLLGNAWKYTKSVPAPLITFSVASKDDLTVYCVGDNGIGFDMSNASNLFSPFQRLHGSDYEGSGIGLSTVKQIIQCHGGRVWFEAKPDEGARFYFTLTPATGEK